MEELMDRIRSVIALTASSVADVGSKENYLDSCGVDSMGFIKILSDLERELGVTLIDDEFEVARISTLDGLHDYVLEKSRTGRKVAGSPSQVRPRDLR